MVMMVRDMEKKEEGRAEGRAEGEDILARLMSALFAEERNEDVKKAFFRSGTPLRIVQKNTGSYNLYNQIMIILKSPKTLHRWLEVILVIVDSAVKGFIHERS